MLLFSLCQSDKGRSCSLRFSQSCKMRRIVSDFSPFLGALKGLNISGRGQLLRHILGGRVIVGNHLNRLSSYLQICDNIKNGWGLASTRRTLNDTHLAARAFATALNWLVFLPKGKIREPGEKVCIGLDSGCR